MNRFLTAVLLLASLCASSQERLFLPSREEEDAPEAIRASALYGKDLVVFGDSYVENGDCPIEETWHYKLAVKYNMEYHNFGLNGNCLAYDWGEQYGPPMYERYKTLPDRADYVVVCAGHNDAVLILRYGDSMDFFRSKLEILCAGLVAKYPEAKICFVSPWKVPQPMYKETTEALLEVCGAYGITVFDSTRHSGIYPRFLGFRSLYFQSIKDMTHLNERGHNLFFPRIEHFLLAI